MRTFFKAMGILLLLAMVFAIWPTYKLYGELNKSRSEDPLVWEENVAALEAKTANSFEAGAAVVFIGSSSIRLWDTLAEDMAPMPVIQHGFGGAKLNDVVFYAERLVNAYQPRAVVVFAGTNDISPEAAKEPAVLLASYQEFVATVREQDADLPIFFIGITPSPLRWSVWPQARETNALIEGWMVSDANQFYIDTSVGLLDTNGEPKRDRAGILQHMLYHFLPSRALRKTLMDSASVQDVDLRASCFHDGSECEVGIVCTICLSIFSVSNYSSNRKYFETCPTCGTLFFRRGNRKLGKKKKKKRKSEGAGASGSSSGGAQSKKLRPAG